MTRYRRLSFFVPITLAVCALFLLPAFQPGDAYAAPSDPIQPLQTIPTWLQDALDGLLIALVKTLQDLARLGGVLLWGILKVCGMVGLFGNDFSVLFGAVVTEALNAVITGSVREVIRGSLMVSLGIFGLSLLARPFWPDLRLVSFQRAVIWGIAIQAYLVSAPTIYAELENWRVNLSEEIASAVSTGAIPGCSGDVVEVLLCITGTSTAEVLDPDLSNLPDQIPYAGSESVRDLYDHCVYNPPVLYGDFACDSANPVGDPWAVLEYAQDALGTQLLGLILAFLILAYGVLQIALGLAAGMMFVLFPVAAIFAFYLPLESFPAGVIRNYISIFLKSVILLTLAGIIIRLFSISTGSLAAMAAVGLIDLLLCFIMAKEALASLLGAVGFVGSSVSAIGANIGLTGGGGGAPLPTPESRTAATMITNSSTMQTLMGSPHPFDGRGTTVLSAAQSALSSPLGAGRAALETAAGAATGSAGLMVGAAMAAKGADYGSLALAGSAISTAFGHDAGRGFVTGAGATAMQQALRGKHPGRSSEGEATSTSQGSPSSGTDGPRYLVPPTRPPASPPSAESPSSATGTSGTVPASDSSPASTLLQTTLQGRRADLSSLTPGAAQRLQDAAVKLQPAPAEVQQSALDLMDAGHHTAQRWESEGRSPIREDGSLDPQFVEDAIERAPEAAQTFVSGQAQHGTPVEQRLAVGDAVALGLLAPQVVPESAASQGLPQTVALPSLTETPAEPAPETQVVTAPEAIQTQSPPTAAVTETGSESLLAQLQSWRTETAAQSGQNSFQVFSNATLEGIAQARPQTLEELAAVNGVGPAKLDRYGAAILGLTQAEVLGSSAQPPSAAEPAPMPSPPEAESISQAAPLPAGDAAYDPSLFQRLRHWRLTAAEEQGQKAFQVFPDATLQQIATRQPATLDELGNIKGVGPKKLEQYGQELLDIISEHQTRQGEES